MKKIITLSLVAVASLGLVACKKTTNESTVVNETETTVTTNEAVTDLNAATDALGNDAVVTENTTETTTNTTTTTDAQ